MTKNTGQKEAPIHLEIFYSPFGDGLFYPIGGPVNFFRRLMWVRQASPERGIKMNFGLFEVQFKIIGQTIIDVTVSSGL